MSSTFSNPITVLIGRLNYHTAAAGRLLWGWHFQDKPDARVDGNQDLPSIVLLIPDVTELYRATRSGDATLSCKLSISVARAEGVAALMDGLAAVMNAIETRADGALNMKLDSTLESPIELTASNGYSTDQSLSLDLVATMRLRTYERGAR